MVCWSRKWERRPLGHKHDPKDRKNTPFRGDRHLTLATLLPNLARSLRRLESKVIKLLWPLSTILSVYFNKKSAQLFSLDCFVSVWPDFSKFCQNIKTYLAIFRVHLPSIRQNFDPTLANVYAIGQIFIVVNGQISIALAIFNLTFF